jgi:hypothetical protein
MAGNDLALMKSQEAAEDDVILSVQDLKRRTDGYDHIVYLGITCGLSAPYVGSQIDWILNSPDAVRRTPYPLCFSLLTSQTCRMIDLLPF